MRTKAEIEEELASMAAISPELQARLDAVGEVCHKLLNDDNLETQWLARQYDGHMSIIFRLSEQSPIPAREELIALRALVTIATIIERLGIEKGSEFVFLANEMLTHFETAIRLRAEIEALDRQSAPKIPAASAMPASSTVH